MKRYKHTLDKVRFNNRWARKYPSDNWVIIGISKDWFSPTEYEYKISFFGLEIRIWMKREFIKTITNE